ncbi:4-oxalocrotonate tautomerase family protein [Streptomyces sp. CC210A]|uniref:tautomerase family protein n=1 Tax=Streptomyces sp. CC210A TaxID=2898184 RepID=UPI001F158620|nr:4-oxalocrotonate tautomerase family protein [Streptomyces sp. CC210A]
MPIAVIASAGALTQVGEREIVPQLSDALIDVSGLTGNTFFTPMVAGVLHLLDPQHVYAGGTRRSLVLIELKLPDIGLASVEARAAFIERATDIAYKLMTPGHDRDDIRINIVNAPDGGWGMGGHAYTGERLTEAITRAAAATGTQV